MFSPKRHFFRLALFATVAGSSLDLFAQAPVSQNSSTSGTLTVPLKKTAKTIRRLPDPSIPVKLSPILQDAPQPASSQPATNQMTNTGTSSATGSPTSVLPPAQRLTE